MLAEHGGGGGEGGINHEINLLGQNDEGLNSGGYSVEIEKLLFNLKK